MLNGRKKEYLLLLLGNIQERKKFVKAKIKDLNIILMSTKCIQVSVSKWNK